MARFDLKLRVRNNPESELVADLQRVANNLGVETITRVSYEQNGRFGPTTIIRRFGSWNKALAAAGLDVKYRQNIRDEEIFENLAAIWETLGRQPVGNDISKNLGVSRFSLGLYEQRFGSWNKALVAFVQYIENPDIENDVNVDNLEALTSRKISRSPRNINWRLRATVLIRDSCICRMCGASPAKDANVVLHANHIFPWSRGGETLLSNLQTLCSVCNIGKSDLVFDD